jgi:hypothetical protein
VNGAPTGTEPGDEVLAGMRQMLKGEVCLPTGERERRDAGRLAERGRPQRQPTASVTVARRVTRAYLGRRLGTAFPSKLAR